MTDADKTRIEKDNFALRFLVWFQNESINYDFQEEVNHSNEEYLAEFKRLESLKSKPE